MSTADLPGPDDPIRLKRRAERERSARLEAEQLLENKSRELYEAIGMLEVARADAERRVAERTAELEEANARLRELAYVDPLTGLANRAVLQELLDSLTGDPELAQRTSVMMVDLNELKTINDEGGHEAGDDALIQMSHLLNEVASGMPGGVAGRFGGDEFCIVSGEATADEVQEAAERLCRMAFELLPHGVSCGVVIASLIPESTRNSSSLLRIADAAQYRAKRSRSRTPVVAGKSTITVAEGAGPSTRRTFRGRALDTQRMLEAAAATLDTMRDAGARERLIAVADIVTGIADASVWDLSRVDGELIHPEQSSTSRLSENYLDEYRDFFRDTGPYALSDFPQTQKVLDGSVVVVRADDPEADSAERAMIVAGGFESLVMVGGVDRDEVQWLLEIYADELSFPAEEYALAFRAAVAMAIAGAGRGDGPVAPAPGPSTE